jgi:lipoprotein-anchoring transpeptidase ErfK/SrfK
MRNTDSRWTKLAALVLIAVARAAAENESPRIVVSIPDRKLAVLDEDGEIVRVFDVAVGAKVSPSPAGRFQVVTRIPHPTYYHPGVVIGPGKANPLGTRWIGLNVKGYGLHGTNAPRTIGRAASHGCIRLRNRDVEALFELVSVGDLVEIRGERDGFVTRVFHTEAAAD